MSSEQMLFKGKEILSKISHISWTKSKLLYVELRKWETISSSKWMNK